MSVSSFPFLHPEIFNPQHWQISCCINTRFRYRISGPSNHNCKLTGRKHNNRSCLCPKLLHQVIKRRASNLLYSIKWKEDPLRKLLCNKPSYIHLYISFKFPFTLLLKCEFFTRAALEIIFKCNAIFNIVIENMRVPLFLSSGLVCLVSLHSELLS